MKRLIGALVLALAIFATAQQQETLTNETVLKMVQAGLGENLIVTMIQGQPGKYVVTPDEMIRMKQAGVSEKILTAMAAKAGGVPGLNTLPAAPVKITANTPIRLTIDEALSSATAKPGQTFKVSTADDLVINGHLVIAKGTATMGKVVAVKHKQGFAAFDGSLEIEVDSIPAVNGQSVPLSGDLTVGGGQTPFGRGSREAEFKPGKVITVHVLNDTTVGQ
jgi:hypothetical protein